MSLPAFLAHAAALRGVLDPRCIGRAAAVFEELAAHVDRAELLVVAGSGGPKHWASLFVDAAILRGDLSIELRRFYLDTITNWPDGPVLGLAAAFGVQPH